jgi:Flp pilus assembly pilin Flp
MKGINRFFKEEKAAAEWGSIYMIVVFAIIAVVLITVIKPMFQSSIKTVDTQPVATPAGSAPN